MSTAYSMVTGFVVAIFIAACIGGVKDWLRDVIDAHASANDARGTRGTGSWR